MRFVPGWIRRLNRARVRWAAGRKNQRYDRQTLQIMRRHLRDDSVCVDIGASQGKVLEWMFEVAPGARHFAFEPLPGCADRLRERFPTAVVSGCALGEHQGRSSFNFVRNDPAYSGLRRRRYDRDDPDIEEIIVDVTRLDDVIPKNVVVSFIKIDVEGGEYHAMRGGLGTIRRCRPVIVFECGASSSSHYGVTPEMIRDLVTSELDLELSTMERWLGDRRSFTRGGFVDAYKREFYFIAYPEH